MVLGFGSRRKKPVEEPVVRPSPSLPQLKEQRIPWPEDLVDLHAVYASDYPSPPNDRFNSHVGPGKVSFQSSRGPIPFHKPFRESTEQGGGMATPRPGNIAGLFGTGVPPPPSSFNGIGPRGRTATHPRTASRRAKHAPTFNIMVVGAKKTGKTALLRLLLSTSNISPTNTSEQLATLASYRSANFAPTTAINTACVEILQSAPNRIPTTDDRIALTCIDTPGLDFTEGKEFALERTVSDILKYLDTQFAETMGEESKVVRTSKGDQHVHLCIYLIDPESVMTPAARQARSRWAAAGSIAPKISEGVSEYDSGSDDDRDEEAADGDDDEEEDGEGVEGEGDDHSHSDKKKKKGGRNHGDDEDEEDDSRSTDDYGEPEKPLTSEAKTPRVSVSQESHIPSPPASPLKSPQRQSSSANATTSVTGGSNRNRLGMSPAEVRVISRLCKRVNLLPVISRADTLTDDRLKRVKQAVRRDLQAADKIGIWGIWDAEPGTIPGRMMKQENMPSSPVHNGNGKSASGGGGGVGDGDDFSVADDDRQSRPVIKLRGPKRGLTRSRSRKSLKTAVEAEFEEPDIEASPGYPLSPTMPNANTMTGPEGNVSNSRRTSAISAKTDAGQSSSYGAIFSRADLRARMPLAIIAPEKERPVKQHGTVSENGEYHVANVYGRFVRRFRWGTIDVLDPHHCDFAALRAAILGSYMKSLKATTRDVLYERFRTEKLLARRATANISEEERKRMIEDLGL